MTAANLSAFRRAFVRGKGDPSEPEYDPTDDDTFFMGIVCAEIAAAHNAIDCAACGSPEIARSGFGNPDRFRTLTTATGALYGYALCRPCLEADPEKVTRLVDLVFDKAIGATT